VAEKGSLQMMKVLAELPKEVLSPWLRAEKAPQHWTPLQTALANSNLAVARVLAELEGIEMHTLMP
jgi:hypothetical protein